jgi:hypothetical protein
MSDISFLKTEQVFITGWNEYFTGVEENAIYTPKLLKGHKPNSSLSMETNFRKQQNLFRTEQQVFRMLTVTARM